VRDRPDPAEDLVEAVVDMSSGSPPESRTSRTSSCAARYSMIASTRLGSGSSSPWLTSRERVQ